MALSNAEKCRRYRAKLRRKQLCERCGQRKKWHPHGRRMLSQCRTCTLDRRHNMRDAR